MANIPFTCGKDCPNRQPGCHGKCEKYKRERAEYDKKKAIENANRMVSQYSIETYGKNFNDLAKRRKNNRGYSFYKK